MSEILWTPAGTAESGTRARLEERTIGGLHDFLLSGVLREYAKPGVRAVDLGAGSGALAERLRALGVEVLAVDIDARGYRASPPFLSCDLNEARFAEQLGLGKFDLGVAVEVIEHLESPIGFLRNVRRLLSPSGVAVVTTPNVENLPARVKFLLRGVLRGIDAQGEPTHITPVFLDLLERCWLPRAGLVLHAHLVYPPGTYKVTRARYAWAFRLLARVWRGRTLVGDTHVFVLKPA